MEEHGKLNVLFLCTANSARSILAEAILNREGAGKFNAYSAGSILAEAILNREGAGKFNAYSAGSMPRGSVHPIALDVLRRGNYQTDQLRSKSWAEFCRPDAPKLDFVFTVCDNAANEVCPVWPGQPMTAHWGVPDPALVEGTDVERYAAFYDTFRMLFNRISIFNSLPLRSFDKLSLQRCLHEIGRPLPDTA